MSKDLSNYDVFLCLNASASAVTFMCTGVFFAKWGMYSFNISQQSAITNQIMAPESVIIVGRYQNNFYRLLRLFFFPRPSSAHFTWRYSFLPHSTWGPVLRLVFPWSPEFCGPCCCYLLENQKSYEWLSRSISPCGP